MRAHAGDHRHLYAQLMRAMADDWEAGGPVSEICTGWESSPPGSVVQLRLLAGLFRLVLRGEAPEIEQYYPCLGGFASPDGAWPDVRRVMAAHVAELHADLEIAPQTNEVGRAAPLLVGLFAAVARTGLPRVRLLELGASGGLNLLLDRYRIEGEGWAHGPADSPVRLAEAVHGPVSLRDFAIVDRRGCDLSPVDPTTEEGELRLRSFVWPWQLDRHARLAAALALAATDPPAVDRSGAAAWLADALAGAGDADTLTVVWQSVTRQYWPVDERAQVDALVRDAGRRRAIAQLAMEFPMTGPATRPAELTIAVGGDPPELLATVGDHGVPVTIR
jgi:hypothetical protein